MNAEDLFIKKLSAPSMAGLKRLITEHPSEAAGLAGALGATGYAYLRNRNKGGEKSKEQKSSDERLAKTRASMKKDKPSFSRDLGLVKAKTQKEVADLSAKHPIRGSLAVAPAGAAGGVLVASAIRKLLHSI